MRILSDYTLVSFIGKRYSLLSWLALSMSLTLMIAVATMGVEKKYDR
jgi:hypothetical protein